MKMVEYPWLIGTGITLAVSLGAVLRGMSNKMSAGHRDLHDRIDEVKEKYVRRDDLDGHLNRVDRAVHELRDEVRKNHESAQRNHEQLLTAITSMGVKK